MMWTLDPLKKNHIDGILARCKTSWRELRAESKKLNVISARREITNYLLNLGWDPEWIKSVMGENADQFIRTRLEAALEWEEE